MKNLHTLFIALSLGVIFSSCHRGKHTSIVSTENNNVQLRIEYSGRIVFNDDKSGVLNISRGGYFKYEKNGEKINIEESRKGIIYQVNGGNESATLDANGKRLLRDAIAAVIKAQGKNNTQQLGGM